MSKLKTLKDIARCNECTCIDGACVDFQILKESAVKWRKAMWEDKGSSVEDIVTGGICGFIDKFFNLTEGDLK